MSKLTFSILLIGVALGILYGGISAYAEWDLNPQMEYTMNPAGLLWVFSGAAGFVSFPFSLIALVVETLRLFKKT